MLLKKVCISRWIISILSLLILNQIVHGLCAGIGMGYYTDPQYFDVWSKLMMPQPGPPPASFMFYSILFNLITSFFFVFVYLIISESIPGTGLVKKGLFYGLIVFMLSGISGALGMLLLINLPSGLIVLWTIESLIICIIGGILVAKIAKPSEVIQTATTENNK
ncbi:hypothetical protein ACFL4Z_02795 [candidate division KSB1 bacterium]